MRPDLYRYGRAALAVLLSATLACAGSPLAYAASASDDADGSASESEAQERWSDHIDDMLASGDYTEGEAVAIVAPSVADSAAVALASADGDSEAASASSLLDEASEELSCTTGDVYEETFDEALPTAALEGARAQALSAAGDDAEGDAVQASDVEVYTLVVKREGMTCEEILRELARDPRVLWAEPNYVYTVPDDQAAGQADDADAQEAMTAVDGQSGEGRGDSGTSGSSKTTVKNVGVSESEVVDSGDLTVWQ